MKCPLSNFTQESEDTDTKTLLLDCLKEECAWWDEVTEQCCVKTVARGIVPITSYLKELIRKMPFKGHFTK